MNDKVDLFPNSDDNITVSNRKILTIMKEKYGDIILQIANLLIEKK